jgi:peptidoglycan hydrolase-like protein with peptidoglycan-binding domain
MTSREKALAGAVALGLLLGGQALAQTTPGTRSVETISVTDARPVAAALDVIEERYGALIDYVDLQYAAPEDIEKVSYRPGRVTPIPKIRSISVQYTQVSVKPEPLRYASCNLETLGCPLVNAQPEGGITLLIRQVVDQFASQAGQVFRVQRIEMPYGPRWEVLPEQARDGSGRFVLQPDVLDAKIYIPKQQRTPADTLVSICDQLTSRWGHKFGVATAPIRPFVEFTGEMGAENVSARDALAEMTGRTRVLRLFYDPDDGEYAINIVNSPYRLPPPPRPLPPPRPTKVAPEYWLRRVRTSEGLSDVQGALAKAGYLHTAPTTQWDVNAADAVRRFQAANGLQMTGGIDIPTIEKLMPYLPKVSLPLAPLMYPALSYWLGSTPQGRMEIQEALTTAGFYSSSTTEGMSDDEMRAALKAFQNTNDLQPNGVLDYTTAEKLAPFLPEPKQR